MSHVSIDQQETKTKTVLSRWGHTCDQCGTPIEGGTRYVRSDTYDKATNQWLYTTKVHLNCPFDPEYTN